MSGNAPFDRGRDHNNIGTLRLLGAFLVLFGHNWALFYGPGVQTDPLTVLVSRWQLSHEVIHGIGINLFFVLSGFLISKSFCSGHGIIRFCLARFMRIFPALAVTVLLSALLLGPLVSTLPVSEYLQASLTWQYIRENATLTRIVYILPEVFTDNPYPKVVNGSLWSLPLELNMYVFALFFGLLTLYRNRLIGALLIFALVAGYFLSSHHFGKELLYSKGLFMVVLHFMLGMLCFMYREQLPLRWWIAVALYVPVVVMPRGLAFELMSSVAFTYLVIWLSFSPSIRLPKVERFGDLSYGLYLYAFPVQQLLVYLQFGSVWSVLFMATMTCLLLAAASWRLVEQPTLKLTKPTSQFLRNGLNIVGLRARWL